MAIDPPWRLDPLQTITDVHWASIIVIVIDFGAYMTEFTDVSCGGGTSVPDGTGPWQVVFITEAEFRFAGALQRNLLGVFKLVPKEVSSSRWQSRPLAEITAISMPGVPEGGSIEPLVHGSQENEGREDLPLGGELHALNPADDRELRADGILIDTKIPRITRRPWRALDLTVSTFWRSLSLGPLCIGAEEGAGNMEGVFQGPRVPTISRTWDASLITADYLGKPYEPLALSVPERSLVDGSEVGGEAFILMVPEHLESST